MDLVFDVVCVWCVWCVVWCSVVCVWCGVVCVWCGVCVFVYLYIIYACICIYFA